ncbi:hypothetical protein BJY01DRAFT_76975 [Aspergillus pseudoustus]|uniref:Uncharacterized protein n=1 Tax=Aspergillus pseudoustus TaxID=1810923 RepID=A0ABR4J5W3_9EURO
MPSSVEIKDVGKPRSMPAELPDRQFVFRLLYQAPTETKVLTMIFAFMYAERQTQASSIYSSSPSQLLHWRPSPRPVVASSYIWRFTLAAQQSRSHPPRSRLLFRQGQGRAVPSYLVMVNKFRLRGRCDLDGARCPANAASYLACWGGRLSC